ncbi:DMT family transporter [Serpentinicella sp. ANB-PHB4]|uniref:DMT family transporter n=1 Tax=Serpentinicella sp. ANB-PHB4 TaxID=3074076 RepID=UPI0028629BBE|nr:DMT family transporter [Serpentinicella sp. ANB-PHB4]MDR5659148.1 DMT family transporter [Serpentinicella sp. ANB-PHB4]
MLIKGGALLIGIVIAVMIQMNGTLSEYTNIYFSSFFVHGTGAIILIPITRIFSQGKKPSKRIPLYYYGGGIIGATIIVLNNISFQKLGVSVTVALVLLGQIIASLVIDTYGLLSIDKVPFVKRKLWGFSLIGLGIIMMFV